LTGPARFAGVARREFAKALRDTDHATAAERLKRTVDEAARLIGRHPALGRFEPKLADTRFRFWSVSGFPYLMVYRPDTSPPSIVRFVHTARDLGPLLTKLALPPDGREPC
jgi:plasmid stabilization system protein ParE